jgi:hypothetical protein
VDLRRLAGRAADGAGLEIDPEVARLPSLTGAAGTGANISTSRFLSSPGPVP